MYISTIPEQFLIIFLGFGLSVLAFSVQTKLNILFKTDKLIEIKLTSYGGIYNFVKNVCNWGVLYLVAAIFLLLSSVFPKNNLNWRPILYNISFVISLITTFYLTLLYFRNI